MTKSRSPAARVSRTIYADNAGHVYQYANGDGNDVIFGFTENDTLQLTSGTIKSSVLSGTDFIINVGSGTITLKEVVGGTTFTMINPNGTSSQTTIPRVQNLTTGANEYINEYDDFTIYALAGNDTVDNYALRTTVDGGAGNDNLYNYGERSLILGADGNDSIENFAQYSTLDGGNGNDYLFNEGVQVSLSGGAGNDTFENFGANSTISGGAGNDTIYNEAENTIFRYANGDGKDVIFGFTESDTLAITSGSIKSTSSNGTDVILNVGSGSVTLADAAGKTINLQNAAGTVTSTVFSGAVTGTARSEKLENYYSNFSVSGLSGNDKISNYGDSVTIDGGTGSDYICNDGAPVSIFGGAGNDTIENSGLEATINGGKGNDTIYNNGNGVVVYEYANGDGRDVIYGFSASDTLKITSGSSSTTVVGSDTIVRVGNGSITLKNYTGSLSGSNGNVAVPWFTEDDANFIGGATVDEITAQEYSVTNVEKTDSTDELTQLEKFTASYGSDK